MVTHHTKEKGDLAVLKVQADLAEQGFLVCTPLTEHAPFDIVIFKSRKFYSVQAKFCSLKNGCMVIDLRRSWADNNGSHDKPYDDGDFDFLGVYCPQTRECYYVPWEICKKVETLSLRLEPVRGRNNNHVRMAINFRELRV